MSYLLYKNLTKSGIKPIYLLYGEEDFLISESIKKIILKLKTARDSQTETVNLDSAETTLPAIMNSLRTTSLFDQRKIIFVKNFDKFLKDDLDDFLSYCRKPIPETYLILTMAKISPNHKLIEVIRTVGEIINFIPLKEGEVLNWLSENLKNRGIYANPTTMKYLLECCGNNLRRINNELEKIMAYSGREKTIDTETIRILVENTSTGNIFSLTDALGEKNPLPALEQSHKIMAAGKEHPLKILTMIVRHLRILLQVKFLKEAGASSNDILKNTGLKSPYILTKYLKQAQKFSLNELKEKLSRCLEIDRKLKSSSIKGNLILEELIVEICR